VIPISSSSLNRITHASTLAEAADSLIAELALRLLAMRETRLVEYRGLHLLVVNATIADPVCRNLMTILGVGPVAALVRTGVDDPHRFRRSRTVAAHFGMTLRGTSRATSTMRPYLEMSGPRGPPGALRRGGVAAPAFTQSVRLANLGAAHFEAWRGKKATVAVSPKLALIMHRCGSMGATSNWLATMTCRRRSSVATRTTKGCSED
jgi:transposase